MHGLVKKKSKTQKNFVMHVPRSHKNNFQTAQHKVESHLFTAVLALAYPILP